MFKAEQNGKGIGKFIRFLSQTMKDSLWPADAMRFDPHPMYRWVMVWQVFCESST